MIEKVGKSAHNATVISVPEIAKKVAEDLKSQLETEKQVIVHCCFPATFMLGYLIRIWPSTFLVDEVLKYKSTLIHHENISLFPYWTEVHPTKDYWFTLVFSGLPKECKSFSLIEEIPEDGGFSVRNIQRNSTDVYRVKII